ncbi:SDR family oxidoreductase [Subtercola frigoramans]|uniref:NAD(P)H dehydrogenase (Quinone) n=1 Tax=Subtercola frigoramans TaxID=120298 RepID=A0ABS2L042_9MICO|nr:SDR family oxidoreductase [Subtercola frigoramans]MBM7470438.1 NAD(P)H dehydrogenase (quinone) [Subtercola frigoramans]
MSIVVTGATGHLGRLIVESLLARGVAPGDIIAAGRNAERLDALQQLGVRTAVIDFSDPSSLAAAFEGADTLVLVSGSEVGQRVTQHSNAIDAAKAPGVTRIVYTSAPRATTSALILAPEHKATEEYLRASGIDFTILRNNWYNENYTGGLGQIAETGIYLASTGEGRVASASRADYAEAIGAVLTAENPAEHVNATYELSGDVAWNGSEFAVTLSDVLGREVTYSSVTTEGHAAALRAAGLDEGTIGFVTALDANIADGLLDKSSDDLSRLIGRPTTPVGVTLAASCS